MLNNAVIVAIISAVGGIITTYLAVKYKNFVFKPPKDRIETIFDGYEALIKQQQNEIDRKSILIDRLEQQLNTMEQLVEKLKEDLNNSHQQIEGLSDQLSQMKADYMMLRKTDAKKSAELPPRE